MQFYPDAIVFSLGVLAFVGAICRWTIARDRRRMGRVGPAAASMIWTIYLCFTALTIAVAWKGIWPLPIPAIVATTAGLVGSAVGAALLIGGLRAFGSLERASGCENDELIQAGVYRWTRNPQNVGWGLVLAGAAMLGGSALALLFAGIFFTAFWLYIPSEERHMDRVFGDEWRRYAEAVPRFIGPPAKERSSAGPVKEGAAKAAG